MEEAQHSRRTNSHFQVAGINLIIFEKSFDQEFF